MNKKKKKRIRKIIVEALLLFLIIGVLGTGTYAWFTVNKIVDVTAIDVNVVASNGLLISADGIDFKNLITDEELLSATKAIKIEDNDLIPYGTYESGINQIPNGVDALLSPVSTSGDINSGRIDMYSGSLETSDAGKTIIVTSNTKETEVNSNTYGKFIAFDMFLKIYQPTQIELGQGSALIAKSTDTDSGIQNAARIAFVYQGNVDINADVSDIQSLNIGNNSYYSVDQLHTGIPTVKIWEPNSKTHTNYGKQNALNVYGKTDKYNSASNTWDNIPYDGVIAPISAADNVPVNATATTHSTKLKSVTPYLYTNGTVPEYTDLFYLNTGISKFRIYMWIEGQDVDCENMASGGSVTLTLQFKVKD